MRRRVLEKSLTLAVVTLTLCCGSVFFARSAVAAETVITLNSVGSAPVNMNAPLGFMDAVKVALARSDGLRSTRVEIESSKLADKDTWYRLFPKLNLVATYNLPVLKDKQNPTKYKESVNLSFNTGNYDPIIAYLSNDVSRSAVTLAAVLHVIAIEEMMEKIGISFITINGLESEISSRKELVRELESLERYTAQKLSAGTIASLDHELVVQRLALARHELAKSMREQSLTRRSLKRLIGLTSQDNVVFSATANATQELTSIQDAEAALQPEALLKNNLQLQAQSLKEKLEGFKVTLAKAEHLPKFVFGLTTPDPLSNQGGNLPYYVTLGATVPIWAWGETMRGVEQAELKSLSSKVKGRLLLQTIQQSADDLQFALQASEESTKLYDTAAKLRSIEAQREEIAFNSNKTTYDTVIAARQAAITSRIEAITSQVALEKARLKLKVAMGKLLSEYVRVNYGELEKN